jgi:hypothetical protein
VSARDRFEALLVIAEQLLRQRRAHWASVQREADDAAATAPVIDPDDAAGGGSKTSRRA